MTFTVVKIVQTIKNCTKKPYTYLTIVQLKMFYLYKNVRRNQN